MGKFEEYSFFVNNTQQITTQRQAATQAYLTVNTGIFAILAFVLKDVGLSGLKLILIIVPLFLVGILACLTWYKLILQYKALISWRYDQLMEIEKSLEMKGCHQFYLKEWEHFYQPRQGHEKFGFSKLEKVLPQLFISLYILIAVGVLINSILG